MSRAYDPSSPPGLKCPRCGVLGMGVSDTRPVSNNSIIRRRRKCAPCGHRVTTYESLTPSKSNITELVAVFLASVFAAAETLRVGLKSMEPEDL